MATKTCIFWEVQKPPSFAKMATVPLLMPLYGFKKDIYFVCPQLPPTTDDDRSRSYYCQPVMPKPKPRPPPSPPPALRRIKHGNFYYASLDSVGATARYGTDKGLSNKYCHSKQYARKLPSGWTVAPYNRAILDYPWSTHCLIFNTGRSYTGAMTQGGQYRAVFPILIKCTENL